MFRHELFERFHVKPRDGRDLFCLQLQRFGLHGLVTDIHPYDLIVPKQRAVEGLFKAHAKLPGEGEILLSAADKARVPESFLAKAKEIAGLHNEEFATNSLSEEEKAAELSAIMALADNEVEQARSAAKLSEKEMIELARQAIITVYGLTDEQMKLIKCSLDYDSNEEFNTYMIQDGKPVYNVWFYLQQAPADDDPDTYTPFTEKDGVYWVDINVETGEIESTTYDTGLGGNG